MSGSEDERDDFGHNEERSMIQGKIILIGISWRDMYNSVK